MGTPTRISVAAFAALLGACATSYKPESVFNDGGFSEQRRAPGVYQVWFVGNEYTTEDRSEDLLLLRAAELCLGESMPFMRTSDFQTGILRSRYAHNLRVTKTAQLGEVTGNPLVPTYTTQMTAVPGRLLYATRSGVVVTCLPEKSDDTQESVLVAASIRERYAIATQSTRRTPSR